MKKYNIQTLGCQMNERDSETLAGMLTEMGYEQAEDRKESDIEIINTCSIRDNADQRFFGLLGQLKKKKEKNKDFIVAVCGCMMQQEHVIETIKEKYHWVDIIFGTHNIHEFPEMLNKASAKHKRLVQVWEDGGEIVEGLPSKRMFKHKAFVNIMNGCNNFCTYCIVPYTRGRERSRNAENIIAEIKDLVADGVKEVTLLGQNVNSYKGEGCADFADLIYKINEIEGLKRLRFMTSHPKDMSDRLIQAYKDCDVLGNYVHMPVQSGNSNILKRMNRRYSREDYLELVRKVKTIDSHIGISTDLIVGFPGETEEEFEDTVSLVKEVGYDAAFTFIYSVRKGTPAENYDDQISEEVKHKRFNRLIEAVNEGCAASNSRFVGRTEVVLVDGPSRNNEGWMSGRTEQNKIVNFPGGEELLGEMVTVKIVASHTFSLDGEIVE